jgi:hypothetical protein
MTECITCNTPSKNLEEQTEQRELMFDVPL